MKKRVLFLFTEVYSSYGGIQNASKQLIRVFRELGFECHALILNDGDEAASAECQAEGFRRSKVRFSLAALRAARREKPDWIVIGHANIAVLVPLLKTMSPETKIAVALHGVEVWGRRSVLVRRGLASADFLTAPSTFTRNQFCKNNDCAEERVRVIPWYVEVNHTNTSEGGGILCVTRLSNYDRYKGVDVLIDALTILRRAGRDIPGTIVGDGELRRSYEQRAQENGIAVTFAGRASDDELLEAYRSCDLFVLPSTKEGFGIVFLEAMHYAKPVICTSRGGQTDIVVDGETGIVVVPSDAGALAKAIETLWDDAKKRKTLGANGRLRAQRVYSFERFARAWSRVIAQS